MEIDFDRAEVAIKSDGTWLSLHVGNRLKAYDIVNSFPPKLHTAIFKLKRKKRSRNANSYFWLLLDKLAAVTRIEKERIYREYIQNIGGNSVSLTMTPPAAEQFIKNWGINGIGWVCDIVGQSDTAISFIAYYGSSTYDTAQMSRLIDLLIYDCKENRIETATPEELALMMEGWGNA